MNRFPAHHYIYHTASTPPYIPAAPGLLLPTPTAALSPTHFYDYPPTAYPPHPPPPYAAAATNSFDAYSPFHPTHTQSGAIGSAAVAAAVAAAATQAGNGSGTTSSHSGSHHPFNAFSTLSGSTSLAANGTATTTGANYFSPTT